MKQSITSASKQATEKDMQLRDYTLQRWKDWTSFEGSNKTLHEEYPLPLVGFMIEYLNKPSFDGYNNLLEAEHYEVLAAARREFATWEQLDAAIDEAYDLAYHPGFHDDDWDEPVQVLTSQERERINKLLDIYEQAETWVQPGGRWELFISYYEKHQALLWASRSSVR